MKIDQVYKEFSEQLERFMLSRTGDRELAKDLVQDTFIKITRYMQNGGTINNVWAFLASSALNTLRDHHRKRSLNIVCDETEAQEVYGDLSESSNPDDLPERYLIRECVRLLVDEIPEPYRYALSQADLEGKPQKELARETGISESGMKSRVQRGRKMLKERLEAILNGAQCNCPCNSTDNSFNEGR